MFHYFFTFFVTAVTLYSLYASVAIVINNLSTDYELSLYAVFQVAEITAMLNLIFVGLFLRHQIAAIFNELTHIYTASKDRELD